MMKSAIKSRIIFMYVTCSLGHLCLHLSITDSQRINLSLKMTVIGSNGGFPITCIEFKKRDVLCKANESSTETFRLKFQGKKMNHKYPQIVFVGE